MSVLSKTKKREIKASENKWNKGVKRRSNGYTGLFGLELEVEGQNINYNPPFTWTTHNDGSLRGDNVEYVLRNPLNYDLACKAITDLFDACKKVNMTFNESNRTSFHVHLNVNEYTVSRLARLVTYYILFEDLLAHYAGAAYRVGNLFALRFKDSAWLCDNTALAFKMNNFSNFGEGQRYSALNFNALNKFGSVEFRLMRGTTNAEDTLTWLAMLNKLHEKSEREMNPTHILDNFSGRELDTLYDVFGRELGDKLIAAAEAEGINVIHNLWEGARIAQDVMCPTDWEEVLRLEKQQYIASPFESPKVGKTASFRQAPTRLRNPAFATAADQWIATVGLNEQPR